MSICPSVGDVGLDHLIKVMFDMCFIFEVVFPFVLNKSLFRQKLYAAWKLHKCPVAY